MQLPKSLVPYGHEQSHRIIDCWLFIPVLTKRTGGNFQELYGSQQGLQVGRF